MKHAKGETSDAVGQNIEARRSDWNFGGNVAENFVEHARRSIPFYEEGHDLVCQLTDFFCLQGSVCYELGTSTGELLRKAALHQEHKPGARWIGIDREPAMIEKAREHCAGVPNVELHCDDVLLHEYEKADLFVAYYCVQFIPPHQRQNLYDLVYERLNWGGAFILFEKVRAPDARFQDMMVSLYNDFKMRNGLSAEEILAKTRSLKGVLEPFSTEGNRGLLQRAGFEDMTTVMKYVSFEGVLAIK